jgi:hypothetical protein
VLVVSVVGGSLRMSLLAQGPLACLLAGHQGVVPMMPEGIVLTDENDTGVSGASRR